MPLPCPVCLRSDVRAAVAVALLASLQPRGDTALAIVGVEERLSLETSVDLTPELTPWMDLATFTSLGAHVQQFAAPATPNGVPRSHHGELRRLFSGPASEPLTFAHRPAMRILFRLLPDRRAPKEHDDQATLYR